MNENDYIESFDDWIDYVIRRNLVDLHTALPAIVESFDASNQTAKVNIAIKRVRRIKNIETGESETQEIPIAPVLNVPVQHPSGGGFHITFPVGAGDECLVVFSERAIDTWWQSGGIQKPLDRRIHAYTDAVAIVGINSAPNAVTNYSTNSLQIRNNDASTYINVTNGTIELNGNTFAGLVKVNELTAKLNALEAEIAGHVHTANNTPSVTVYTPFVAANYENDTVVHG